MSGHRWLALDADLFGKRFTADLYDQFGWAGITTWVAFLCACKRSPTPGRISFLNDVQAAHELGVDGWDLVDSRGEPWTLTDFWTFTGRKKQTRRTPNGRRTDVVSTHWERWQDDARMQNGRERKRRWRGENGRDTRGTSDGTQFRDVPPDSDSDIDLPPPPSSTGFEATTGDARAPDGSGAEAPERRGVDHGPPGDLLAGAAKLLARRRLDDAKAAAGAGQREPIRDSRRWLRTAAAEVLETEAPALTTAWRLAGHPTGVDELVDAWCRLPDLRAAADLAVTRARLDAEAAIAGDRTAGRERLAEIRRSAER